MAINFSSSLAAIKADLNQRSVWLSAILIFLLFLWFVWLFWAPLSVTKQGDGALQNGQPEIFLTASVDGRIHSVDVVVGDRVDEGKSIIKIVAADDLKQISNLQKSLQEQVSILGSLQSLYQNDSEKLKIQYGLLLEKISTLKKQVLSIDTQYNQQMKLVSLLAGASGAVSKVELQKEQLQLQQLYERLLTVHQEQVAADSEILLASEQKNTLLVRFEHQKSDQQSRIAALEIELAKLQKVAKQKVLLAPKSARVAEIMPLQPGQWVSVGTKLATLIPDGDLQVVAQFEPSDAQGYLRAGQRARVQIDSFPWLQFGAVNAEVIQIDEAARDGAIRVVLMLKGKRELALRSGMTGRVIVDVATVTPWQLLMLSLGRQ